MKDIPAILFPHSFLPERGVKRVLSFFEPLTIFQPWFMERPIVFSEADGPEPVQVMHPPEDLMPDKGFSALLGEFHAWAEQNQDRGYTAFLKARQDIRSNENTTWEIRQMIRKGVRPTLLTKPPCQKCRPDPFSLKWHLILHLAQDIEDQRLEADRVLKILRGKATPLKGIIEGSEEVKGLLEDLPPFESEPIGGENRLRQIFEAWFGLFAGYLKGSESLVTCHPQVMDYVTELWEECGVQVQADGAPFIRFKSPDLSHHRLEDLMEIKKRHFKDDRIRELKDLIRDFGKNAMRNLSSLENLIKEAETSLPWDLSEGGLSITVKAFSPVRDVEQLKRNELLKQVSNKTVILVEQCTRSRER